MDDVKLEFDDVQQVKEGLVSLRPLQNIIVIFFPLILRKAACQKEGSKLAIKKGAGLASL